MSSLDNHPLWCSRHGFTDVIRPGNTGVASVRKENCPWCRAEKAEAALATARETAVREFAHRMKNRTTLMRSIWPIIDFEVEGLLLAEGKEPR